MTGPQGSLQKSDPVEQALARATLLSERLRVTILAGVIAVALASWLASPFVLPLLDPGGTESSLIQQRGPIVAVLAVALVYELIARTAIGYFYRTHRHPPILARYANALIETSLPTAAIVATTTFVAPAYALLLPPASFFFLLILLATLRLDFWLCVFVGAVAATEYGLLTAVFLGQAGNLPGDPLLVSWFHHGARAALFLVAGVLAGFVSLQLRGQLLNTVRSVEERNRVISTFGQHVSSAVADELLRQVVDLDGKVRPVCVMVLDIRDFSDFASGTSPDEVVRFLNVLFGPMIESVNRHQGIVNKFLGDGFMAIFGAPIDDDDACGHAVAAAREIVDGVERMNAAGTIPPTRIGIGLHAGEW